MNCELCQSELEDFLYGELTESRASQVRAHLAGCGACASAHALLERENELFAQYYEESAVEPSAEMWPAIRERIRSVDQAPQSKKVRWFADLTDGGAFAWLFRPSLLRQAAFSVFLVVLTAAVTTWVLKRGKDEVRIVEKNIPASNRSIEPAPTQPPLPTPSPKGSVVPTRRIAPRVKHLSDEGRINIQIARAEREYKQAIKLLDSSIAKRKEGLSPEIVRQYQSSLTLIDSSIAASRRALRERPNDLAAGQFLLAAYAKKVELMQDFSMR
jgi:putative zinc finger protein